MCLFCGSGAEPANEDDNKLVPTEFGRLRPAARCALHAVHAHRRPAARLCLR